MVSKNKLQDRKKINEELIKLNRTKSKSTRIILQNRISVLEQNFYHDHGYRAVKKYHWEN